MSHGSTLKTAIFHLIAHGISLMHAQVSVNWLIIWPITHVSYKILKSTVQVEWMQKRKLIFNLSPFLKKVNISQNNVECLSNSVLTNQTLISKIIQSRNKEHATKWLLHGCVLVKPCSNPYLDILIKAEWYWTRLW